MTLSIGILLMGLDLGPATAPSWHEQAPNPGFEGGIAVDKKVAGRLPEGWTLWGAGRVDVVTDPASVRTGRQAVRLAWAEGGAGCRLHPAQRLEVHPGEQYELSVWVRGKGTATLFVWNYAVNGAFMGGCRWHEGAIFRKTLIDQWQELRAVYEPDDDSVGFATPGVELSPAGADAWIDDFSFRIDRHRFPLPQGPDAAWVLGAPSAFYIPEGGVAYLMVSLQAPMPVPVHEFRVSVEAPAGLVLLNRPEPKPWGGWQWPPQRIDVADLAVEGMPGRRYELTYDRAALLPHDAVIEGYGWQLKAPGRGHAPVGPLFFQMKGPPLAKPSSLVLRRIVNGTVVGKPLALALHVMPPFSGTRPRRVDLYHYSTVTFPTTVGQWGVRYPDYIKAPLYAQLLQRGITRCEAAGWDTLKDPPACALVNELAQRGVKIGFARLSGMPYAVMAGGPPEKLSDQARLLLAHPEHQAVWWSHGESLIPEVWKPSVYFRWFNTKMLFDPEYIAREKPVGWCPQYMADGGPLWLDFWRRKFQEARRQLPAISFVHWDWEYANVGFSCFCARCLEAFRKHAKLPADVPLTPLRVAQQHAAAWMQFRAVQHAGMIAHFHQMLNAIGLEFELYSASSGRELVEGLDWTLLPGHVDYLFAGTPGASAGRWYAGLVEEADRIMKLFPGKRVTGQLVYDLPYCPRDVLDPRQRKNDVLRAVTALRGGVNEWVNVGQLNELNGVDCFSRQAADVLIRCEDYIVDGTRAADEFALEGLRPRDDHTAFRLGSDQPVLLFVWNDGSRARDVRVRWHKAGPSATYTCLETGRALGRGPTLTLALAPHSTAVVVCRP